MTSAAESRSTGTNGADDVHVLPDGDGKRHVEPEVLTDGELRLTRVRAEAGRRDVEAVLADLELGQREQAGLVGGDRPRLSRVAAGGADRGPCNRRAGLVRDPAAHRCT